GEQVVAGCFERRLALVTGGETDRLDGLDAEGLDDGLEVRVRSGHALSLAAPRRATRPGIAWRRHRTVQTRRGFFSPPATRCASALPRCVPGWWRNSNGPDREPRSRCPAPRRRAPPRAA